MPRLPEEMSGLGGEQSTGIISASAPAVTSTASEASVHMVPWLPVAREGIMTQDTGSRGCTLAGMVVEFSGRFTHWVAGRGTEWKVICSGPQVGWCPGAD